MIGPVTIKSILFNSLLIVAMGCAHPHRTGCSSHEVRIYQGRSDGLIRVETWKDLEKGGGTFLLTDPSVASLTVYPTNQDDPRGGSYIGAGQMTPTVDPEPG